MRSVLGSVTTAIPTNKFGQSSKIRYLQLSLPGLVRHPGCPSPTHIILWRFCWSLYILPGFVVFLSKLSPIFSQNRLLQVGGRIDLYPHLRWLLPATTMASMNRKETSRLLLFVSPRRRRRELMNSLKHDAHPLLALRTTQRTESSSQGTSS